MSARPKRTPWQVMVIEVILAAVLAVIAYALAAHPFGHGPALILGGIVGGLCLRMATRHAARKPKRRKSATRRTVPARRR